MPVDQPARAVLSHRPRLLRNHGRAQLVLPIDQKRPALRVLFPLVAVDPLELHWFGRHVLQVVIVPQVKERLARRQLRLPTHERRHHRVQHLQLRHGPLLDDGRLQSRIPRQRFRGNVARSWNPPIALPQEAQEERPAAVDVLQAHLHHALVVRGIRLAHAPAQVDVDQTELSLLAPVAQLGEHLLDQVVPLPVHVVERAGDKDVNRLPAHSPALWLAWRLFASGAHDIAFRFPQADSPTVLIASTCASIPSRHRTNRSLIF